MVCNTNAARLRINSAAAGLDKLPTPPSNAVQKAQAERLARATAAMPRIPSEAVAGLAYQNLYMRYVNPFKVVDEYQQGLRVRVVDGQLYYKPEPPDLVVKSASGDMRGLQIWQLWEITAAHALTWLSLVVAKHPN